MKGKKIFWGLFFILAAGLVIVNQLGMFVEISLISMFFTVFLVAILIESLFHLSFTGILFSLAFLAIIYAQPLNITNLTPWPVLAAALLGSIGLSIVFGKKHNEFHHHHGTEPTFAAENIGTDGSCDNINGVVNINVSFGSSAKYIYTNDLQRVNVGCSFGAVKIYLDNATLKDNTAVLDLNASFSGIELYIPRTWQVENNANVSLAGIDEKNASSGTFDNKLILTGKLNLSGVEIIYV